MRRYSPIGAMPRTDTEGHRQRRSRLDDKRRWIDSITAQVSLPHRLQPRQPWETRNGKVSLRIEPGVLLDPATNEWREYDVPYGPIPRLALIHIQNLAYQIGSPLISVGATRTEFTRSVLGRQPSATELRWFGDHFSALAAADFKFGFDGRTVQFHLAGEVIMSGTTWPQEIRLSQEFYDHLTAHGFFVPMTAIQTLRRSSLAIDIYLWLSCRTHGLRSPAFIPWAPLAVQFGAGFTRFRDFRRAFSRHLSQILEMPNVSFRVEVHEHGPNRPAGLLIFPTDGHEGDK